MTYLSGTVLAYLGLSSPQGWLLCDGNSFDASQYKQLYNILQSNKLPDLRGMFVRGTGFNSQYTNAYGQQLAGQSMGLYEQDNVGDHNHSYSANQDDLGFKIGLQLSGAGEFNRLQYVEINGEQLYPLAKEPDVDGGIYTKTNLQMANNPSTYNETYPPSITVNYIIKI